MKRLYITDIAVTHRRQPKSTDYLFMSFSMFISCTVKF